jgi:hypothetical protein
LQKLGYTLVAISSFLNSLFNQLKQNWNAFWAINEEDQSTREEEAQH